MNSFEGIGPSSLRKETKTPGPETSSTITGMGSLSRASGRSVGSTSSIQSSLSPNAMSVLSLEQEIDEVEIMGEISGVILDQADLVKRTCNFRLVKGSSFLDIKLSFPPNYPIKISPAITIHQTNVDQDTLSRILKAYSDTCTQHVKQHVNCVEPCLRQILLILEKSDTASATQESAQPLEDRKSMLDKKYTVEKVKSPSTSTQQKVIPMYPNGSFQDACIPFPRTCGARFCSNDRLVTFGVPAAMKKVHEDSEVTPRALSDLVSYSLTQSQWIRSQSNPFVSMSLFYGSPPTTVPEGISISNFYTEKAIKNRHYRQSHHHHKAHSRSRDGGEGKREKEVERMSKRLQKVGSVKVYDISCINPVSKYLAENYILDVENVCHTCEHNAGVAMKIGRKDLVQLWQLISQMSDINLRPSPNIDRGPPWAYIPFGRPLLKRMLKHYSKMGDVQTMAMLCCIFWDKEPPQKEMMSITTTTNLSIPRNESRSSFEYAAANPQPEITLASSSDSGWHHVFPVMKSKRSLSWSESYDDFKMLEDKDPREREVEKERILHHNNSKMLDPELKSQYEQIKKAYANILFKWGLLNQRRQILKHTTSTETENQAIDFIVTCFNCSETVRGVQCGRCKYPALRCSICHIGVRGAANFCIACGHGGHTSHIMDWFSSQTVCPSGCGCNCAQESAI